MSGAIPPLPQCAFMVWCSVKAQGQLFLYLLPLPVMEFIENYRFYWVNHVPQLPHSEFSITNKRTKKIFGKTLKTLSRDPNRPLGLKIWKADHDNNNTT
jgi:hypothetical protein